jgi:uncharacterized membrane protein
MKRINSIDTTRGIVMIIMALDHVRDFMHKPAMIESPTNLQTTTAILFFTRWITHLCAPSFVFLSGISAYISFKRTNNLNESRRFLLTRGIWLVILELTLVNFALWFDIQFRLELLEVISAIGLSFIILSFLLTLPSRTIGIIGLIIIFSHNLLQGLPQPENDILKTLFLILFRPGLIQVSADMAIFTAYPVVPWLGIMLCGFGTGELFSLPEKKRKKLLLMAGVTALSLGVLIRLINVYGDPAVWAVQKSSLFTLLSFINLTKYPPSLLFTLFFAGFTLILLFLTDRPENKVSRIVSVYGRVPLFYFILHLYIIHSLMYIMLFLQGFGTGDMVFGLFSNGRPRTGGGVDLTVVYLIWIVVVASLYPVCKWYGNYKASHPEKRMLRYL